MIRSGTVSLARSAGRLSVRWIALATLLFALQFLYPAVKSEFEARLWNASLSTRADALLSTFVLDGVLNCLGLLAGFCVSSAMYVLALGEQRGRPVGRSELLSGVSRIGEFLPLAFAASVFEGVAWFLVTRHAAGYAAIGLQLLLVWACLTPFIFVVPLIVDGGHSAGQAVRSSARAVARQPVSAFFLLLSAGFWSYVGAIGCFLGAIATLPIYQRAISRAYLDCFDERAPVSAATPESSSSP